MVEVPLPSYHIVLADVHTGMLVLAGLCILSLAVMKALRGAWKFTDLWMLIEPVSFFVAILGAVIFVLTGIVGILMAPIDVLLILPVVQNKVMFAVFALDLWIMVIVIRARFGAEVWNNLGLSATYTLVTIAALGFLTLTDCSSARLTMRTSPFEPLWQLLGVNLDMSMMLSMSVTYVILFVGIALIAAALLLSLK